MTIKQRASLFSGAMLLLIFVSGILIAGSIHNLKNQSKIIRDTWKPVSDISYRMQLDVLQVQQWLTDISATRAQDGLNDGFDEAEAAAQSFVYDINLLSKLLPQEKGKIDALRPIFDRYYAVGKQMAQAYIDGGPATGNQSMAQFDEGAENLHKALDKLVASASVKIEAAYAQQDVSLGRTQGLVIVTFVVIVVLLVFMILQGNKKIILPLGRIKSFIEITQQKGDFSNTFNHNENDEIGVMASSLNKLFSGVNRLVAESNSVLLSVENGEFKNNRITSDFNGDLGKFKLGINKAIDDMLHFAEDQQESQASLKAQQSELEKQQKKTNEAAEAQKETNMVLESQQKTMLEQQKEMEKSAKILQEQNILANQRSAALNAASANITLLDENDCVIFCNTSAQELLKKHEHLLRTIMPSFSAQDLHNQNLQKLFKFPAGCTTFSGIVTASDSELNIDNQLFWNVIAVPVFDQEKVRIGTVIEWQNNSDQVAALQVISSAVDRASNGELAHNIQLNTESEFIEKLGNNLNTLIDSVRHAMAVFSTTFEAMEKGDVGIVIKEDLNGDYDAIKQSTNNMLSVWRGVLVSVQELSGTVRQGAEGIASSAQQLSSRAEQQASSLEETSSSMAEMTDMIESYSGIHQQGIQLSTELKTITQNGNLVVKETATAITDIQQASQKISGITVVIDEIAFQTNLLALNAAVEAARAGDSGRGFAVVAAEVRNLAQRSSSAAKEIATLINDTVSKAEVGAVLAERSRDTFSDIQKSVDEVGSMMAKIREGADEQHNSVKEIKTAIYELDKITQANSSDVDSLSNDCSELFKLADSLQGSLSFFQGYK